MSGDKINSVSKSILLTQIKRKRRRNDDSINVQTQHVPYEQQGICRELGRDDHGQCRLRLVRTTLVVVFVERWWLVRRGIGKSRKSTVALDGAALQ
jgi:hypothetical protein